MAFDVINVLNYEKPHCYNITIYLNHLALAYF